MNRIWCSCGSEARALAAAGLLSAAVASLAPGGEDPGRDLPQAEAQSRPASRAPQPWRADQVQRRSEQRPPKVGDPATIADAIPVIMAGSADIQPPDSPDQRIDDNSAASPFAGVCSITIISSIDTSMCSGTPISRRHILTAGHCFDAGDHGDIDSGIEVWLTFNATGDSSHLIGPGDIAALHMHPDFSGFSNPNVNDDLLLIELYDELPAEIPHYPVYRGEVADGEHVTLVGYGRSGHGDMGLSAAASPTVKRTGANLAEEYFENDEAGADTLEVWRADFDGHIGANCVGSTTLGNDIETSSAPGDSGGPALIETDGQWQLWGVNTYGEFCAGPAFQFGGGTGGIVANAYLPWIDLYVECAGNCNDCNDNGIPDGIDILEGTLSDEDGNNFPDECASIGAGDLWISNGNNYFGHSVAAGQAVISYAQSPVYIVRFHDLPDGSIAALGPFGAGVMRMDPLTGKLFDTYIPATELTKGPHSLAVSAEDGIAYVAHWTGGTLVPGIIARHDAETGAFIDHLVKDDPDTPDDETGGMIQPVAIAIGPDDHLYVTGRFSAAVRRYDRHTGEYLGVFASTTAGGSGNTALRFHDDLLWVLEAHPGATWAFDATTGEPVHEFPQTNIGTSANDDFAITDDDRLLVLTSSINAGVRAYDLHTGEFLELIVGNDEVGTISQGIYYVDDGPAVHQPDINNDGGIDADDLVALLAAWGDCDDGACVECAADLNADCIVGVSDLLELLSAW